MAALNYQPYDRMPVVRFGYWNETLGKWAEEGHISRIEAKGWSDGNEFDQSVSAKLGLDFNWGCCQAGIHADLLPGFPREVVKDFGNGRAPWAQPQRRGGARAGGRCFLIDCHSPTPSFCS